MAHLHLLLRLVVLRSAYHIHENQMHVIDQKRAVPIDHFWNLSGDPTLDVCLRASERGGYANRNELGRNERDSNEPRKPSWMQYEQCHSAEHDFGSRDVGVSGQFRDDAL